MTVFVLVHGAWHGPWAWDRLIPLLLAADAQVLTPDLSAPGDHGLHDHGEIVVAALDSLPDHEEVVLVGHSYAGLVVREAADRRPDSVDHLVLVDGWAGGDGTGLFDLAPPAFEETIRTLVAAHGDERQIPAPSPAAFGIVDADHASWLATRMVPQPLRTFVEPTRLTGAVDRIPGTAIYCRPQTYPFDRFGKALGYQTLGIDGPHDVMLTHPESLAKALLQTKASFMNSKSEL